MASGRITNNRRGFLSVVNKARALCILGPRIEICPYPCFVGRPDVMVFGGRCLRAMSRVTTGFDPQVPH